MQQALLDQLRKITEEERKILDGEAEVDRDLYTSGRDFTVDSGKIAGGRPADRGPYPYPFCAFSGTPA